MIVDYKNSTVHYTIDGEGPALVLLHGFLETVNMWDAFIPELSESHMVICIDLLGHGKTDSIGYVHTMEDMAEAVYYVLQHLNVKQAKIVGHSMGGYVALALAEHYPELINGLCLLNSTFEADDDDRKLLRARAVDTAKTNYENLVRMSFANLFAPESRVTFQTEYEDALKIALQTSVQGYIAANNGMALRPNRLEVFKNVNGEALIITGKKDTLINPKFISEQIQNSKIIHEELSEGHMSHIENKSDLSYFLKRFIEK
ncbi:alpha/beta fold hydrolase [Winogradskyella tangerina]|uniref:alpha/beta fold hydrolase n=1 Tax=Winogradskyella tangerina TaxID=2023240 RepID=UPI000DBE7CBA|nr:alpha/beta fold hydrolase [Winogradskyella tangerina]